LNRDSTLGDATACIYQALATYDYPYLPLRRLVYYSRFNPSTGGARAALRPREVLPLKNEGLTRVMTGDPNACSVRAYVVDCVAFTHSQEDREPSFWPIQTSPIYSAFRSRVRILQPDSRNRGPTDISHRLSVIVKPSKTHREHIQENLGLKNVGRTHVRFCLLSVGDGARCGSRSRDPAICSVTAPAPQAILYKPHPARNVTGDFAAVCSWVNHGIHKPRSQFESVAASPFFSAQFLSATYQHFGSRRLRRTSPVFV